MTPAIKRLTELRVKAWPNSEPRRLAAVQLVQDLKQVARAAGFETNRLGDKGQSGITIAFPAEANVAVSVSVQTNDLGVILIRAAEHESQFERLQLQFDDLQGGFVPRNGAEPLDELADAAANHLELALKAKGHAQFQP